MLIRKLFSQLELSPGDLVVSITTFRDRLIVVTQRGAIYEVYTDD